MMMVITKYHIAKIFVIRDNDPLFGNGTAQNVEITGLRRFFAHADGIKTLPTKKVGHGNTGAFINDKFRH
jgi:hypothetical protein